MEELSVLNNLSEIADKPEGLYSLPDGYHQNVLDSVRLALNFCYMRRQIWREGDSSIRIVPPDPKSGEARPFEFELYRTQLYQYLLVLDCANELLTKGKKTVWVKPDRDIPNLIPHAQRIADTVHGMKVRFEEHPEGGAMMIDREIDIPLTKRVFNAMKSADENGRFVMDNVTEKLMSVKTYVSSYRHVFPGVSISIEGRSVIFEKGNETSGDVDSFLERLHRIIEDAPGFAIIPIDLSIVPVSPNYFRTKIKSIPVIGYDLSVTIQSKEGRVLVSKVSDDWECAMSAEPDDIVDPDWDDDEAYPEDDKIDGFEMEPENNEIL